MCYVYISVVFPLTLHLLLYIFSSLLCMYIACLKSVELLCDGSRRFLLLATGSAWCPAWAPFYFVLDQLEAQTSKKDIFIAHIAYAQGTSEPFA